MEATPASRKWRKEEGRRLKKQRIEAAGGVRPRSQLPSIVFSPSRKPLSAKKRSGNHRFGRVMDTTPCRNKPRNSTLSIAIPGSVVSNCQTRELKTHLVGQIARAATIYHVDEIIVFDDKLAKARSPRSFYGNRNRRDRDSKNVTRAQDDNSRNKNDPAGETPSTDDQHPQRSSDPHTFMARVLQYCECPQYLRRHFFPMHPDLQFSGLLAPIDAPHHVRAEDRCKYREGVVLDKTGPDAGSLVNCGIRGRPVE